MVKQSVAKAKQNYRKEPDKCSNCANYKSEFVEKQYEAYNGLQVWDEEINKRCGLGGFKVAKNGTCDLHVLQQKAVKCGS